MKDKKSKGRVILWLCIGIICIASLCIHARLLQKEYTSYQAMYERGKTAGKIFTDCVHTRKYGIDYVSSFATRKQTALSTAELEKFHPTVWSYMFCCGLVQEKIYMWLLQEALVFGIGGSILFFSRPKKKITECTLDKEEKI